MSEFRVNSITNQDGSAGPQICGVSTFSGTSGVQIPSWPTEFRRQDGGGRGRGVVAGGYNPSLTSNTSFITIATLGNSNNFGDLTVARRGIGAAASSTRAAFAGGQHPSSPNNTNTIDYVAIATTGDAIDFGDLGQSNSGQKRNVSGCSNGHGGL